MLHTYTKKVPHPKLYSIIYGNTHKRVFKYIIVSFLDLSLFLFTSMAKKERLPESYKKGFLNLQIFNLITSVIRQKGVSQNGGNKKRKHAKFSPKNEHFLAPDTHTCVYQGLRNVRFSENLTCFVFLLPPF